MSEDDGDIEREGKGPDAFRTISEVAEELGLPQHVLRFWETRFPQIKPIKRGGGRRYYRPNDVELLRGVKQLLYGEGYTIRGVQRILREQGGRKTAAAAGLMAAAEQADPPLEREQPSARKQAPVRQEPSMRPEPRSSGLMGESAGPDFWAPAGRAAARRAQPDIADEDATPDEPEEALPQEAAVVSSPGMTDDQRARLLGALDALLECRRLLAGRP